MKRLFAIFRRATQAALLSMVSVSVVLLLLELGVRLVSPQQLILLRPDIWQPAEVFGWRHTPGVSTTVNTGEGTVRVVTNARGHRVGEVEKEHPELRILALGDSFVEAIQVEWPDTTTAQLERLVSEQAGKSVRVENTGVGGWGPDQYLFEARRELDRVRYDAALTFVYLPNDRVYERYEAFSPRQAAARRPLRMPRALTKRELVDALAYPVNNVLEERSHLFILLRNRAKFLLMRAGLSAHYFPAVLVRGATDATSWRLTSEALTDIHREATRQGVPHLVVFLPGIYQVDPVLALRYAAAVGLGPDEVDLDLPSSLLAGALDAAGVPWLDTLPVLRRAHESGASDLFGRVDTHLAPSGHRVVAEAVTPLLLALLDGEAAVTPPRSPGEG